MAKIVIQHDEDPAIGIVLEYVRPGSPGRATGWHGTCTECGRVMHWWKQETALNRSRRHVDEHEAQVIGVDPSSVVR